MWKKLNDDIVAFAYYAKDFFGEKPGLLRKVGIFLTPSLLCCFFYRIANKLWQWKLRPLARLVTNFNYVIHKAWINPAADIKGGLYIPHTVGIVIEGNAGKNLTVLACAILGAQSERGIYASFPNLGNNVMLGTKSIVYAGVSIGDFAKVGPYSIVARDMDPYTTAFSAERCLVTELCNTNHEPSHV